MNKPTDTSVSDLELVERIRGGDPAAESALISKYESGVWAILARWRIRGAVEVADLFQEAWLRVLNSIRAGKLEAPEALRQFIATTTHFVLNAAYRYEKRRRHEDIEDGAIAAPEPPQWMVMDRRFRTRMVQHFLSELRPIHREILFMYFVSELSREEICETLEISRPLLSRRLYEAKVSLRNFLNERMPDFEWNNDRARHKK